MKRIFIIRVFTVPMPNQLHLTEIAGREPCRVAEVGDQSLFAEFEFESDDQTQRNELERYCSGNRIRFWALNRREYSEREIEATEFFLLRDEDSGVSTTGTECTAAAACPKCGIGLQQTGPLVLNGDQIPKRRKLFCVSLQHSREWVIRSEAADLFRGLTGFEFGETVVQTRGGSQIDPGFKQIRIDSGLPRMAPSTNFVPGDPPPVNPCACNRSGWNLRDEVIYQRQALANAKDFNLTMERWFGGGRGIQWPIVSGRVRTLLLSKKILKKGCFDPVSIEEGESGGRYRFEVS